MRNAVTTAGRILTGASVSDTRSGDLSRTKLVAFVLWRMPLLLLIAGSIWEPVRGALWSGGFGWIGISCTFNAFKCGRTHCALMGSLFLALSIASIAETLGALAAGWTTLGLAGVGAVVLSFVPEWLGHRYLRAPPTCDPETGK